MADRLLKINAQIDEFIQEKLGNRYKDILDYNLNTPNRAEPITLLILYDFPSGMDGRSIDLLTNILRNIKPFGNVCTMAKTYLQSFQSVSFSRWVPMMQITSSKMFPWLACVIIRRILLMV